MPSHHPAKVRSALQPRVRPISRPRARIVNEFNGGQFAIVAVARAELNDARVAARPAFETLAQFDGRGTFHLPQQAAASSDKRAQFFGSRHSRDDAVPTHSDELGPGWRHRQGDDDAPEFAVCI